MAMYDYPAWVSLPAKLLPASLRRWIRGQRALNQRLLAWANRTPIRTIAIDKLLLGGEAGLRAVDLARLFNEPLRPSTRIADGHHVALLKLYSQHGEAALSPEYLSTSSFYANIEKCMAFTGHYRGFTRTSDIATIARNFCASHAADIAARSENKHPPIDAEPIMVMPVAHSSYYQIIDGHHRAARAVMAGSASVRCVILPETATTHVQELLKSVLWVSGRREIYQPIELPEIAEGWVLVRACHGRLAYMQRYLQQHGITAPASYCDLGSNHGWFVKQMLGLGYDATGVERDYFGRQLGVDVYGLDASRITLSDLENYLEASPTPRDIVSCFSVFHHYFLSGNHERAARAMRLIDAMTKKVCFFETAHGHENIHPILDEWNDASIAEFIRANSSFKHVELLGHDHDNIGRFKGAYKRALFACSR